MDWGIKNRLSRIIRPDGKTVMLAVDHEYFLGPTSGLEDAGRTIGPLLSYADALMPTRGVLRTSVDASTETPIVLRVSGGNSILGELSNEGITVAMEDAVRLINSRRYPVEKIATRGRRHTMLNDSDINNTRHARAVASGNPSL